MSSDEVEAATCDAASSAAASIASAVAARVARLDRGLDDEAGALARVAAVDDAHRDGRVRRGEHRGLERAGQRRGQVIDDDRRRALVREARVDRREVGRRRLRGLRQRRGGRELRVERLRREVDPVAEASRRRRAPSAAPSSTSCSASHSGPRSHVLSQTMTDVAHARLLRLRADVRLLDGHDDRVQRLFAAVRLDLELGMRGARGARRAPRAPRR